MNIYKINYDVERFDFRTLVKLHYNFTKDLKFLHEWLEKEVPFFATKDFDQSTDIHKHFYKIYDQNACFINLYQQFLKEIIQPSIGEALVYQAKPTFRIHLPNNVAVGEWHKDSDYNHQRTETNYWLPFTDAFGNNTIWMESEEDLGDFKPYDVAYGEVLVFKGASLQHGNKANDTGVSRVSMDFRVIPHSQYQKLTLESSNLKLKFQIGEYYNLLGM